MRLGRLFFRKFPGSKRNFSAFGKKGLLAVNMPFFLLLGTVKWWYFGRCMLEMACNFDYLCYQEATASMVCVHQFYLTSCILEKNVYKGINVEDRLDYHIKVLDFLNYDWVIITTSKIIKFSLFFLYIDIVNPSTHRDQYIKKLFLIVLMNFPSVLTLWVM